MSAATRFVQCSLASGEDAPFAKQFYSMLQNETTIGPEALERLQGLVVRREYAKALRVRLPNNTKAYTIRGLLYAQIGRTGAAKKAFVSALELDTGNDLAKRTLRALR